MSGSSLREQVETLSADRARLLELMLQNASPMATALKPYPRAPGEVRFPTSWAQQRLWFVYQLEGAAAAYNIPWVVRLCGVLDESALRDALHALVRRHEVLRTVFVNVEGDPRQDVRQDVRFSLQRIDLQDHAPAQREHQVRLQQREESQAPFDLSEGPLIRGRLLHLQENEHLLLITMHHIVSDGWSMGVMFRELAQLYGAFHEGRPDPLPPLPIQYADYVKWQREWLQGKVLEKQLAFWRARLEDAAPELELPIDHPRPVTQSYRGQRVPVVFDAKLSARLRALARRHGMTVFMVLYAAWAILLSRLSGQEDIVIGTPAANRRRPQLEGLIGFFVNTLVLRVAVAGEARVSEFLKQVKEVTLSAFEHQDVPFEQLVESLRPQRAMNRHPIFQTMFVLQNAPQSELTMPQLTIAIEESLNETSKFDLLLSLEECGDQIVGNLNYDTALFERGTMERWLARYGVLLEAIVQSDSTPIEHLPILPESERRLILEQFNATHAPYTPQQPIHRLFEQQAERTPDAAAVVHGQCSLTYAQLNRRANRLARYLRTKHVGPDELVCVCLERGLDMVMAVLGISRRGVLTYRSIQAILLSGCSTCCKTLRRE